MKRLKQPVTYGDVLIAFILWLLINLAGWWTHILVKGIK